MSIIEYLFEKAVEENKKRWSKLYDENVRYTFPIPDITLKMLFNEWAEKRPGKTYIYHQGKEYSYQECNLMARKIANGLVHLGGQKGDRVLTFLRNGFELICTAQACFKTGLILVNCNPLDSPAGMAYRIKDCTARFVIVEATAKESVDKAMLDSEHKPEYIVLCGSEFDYEAKCEKSPKEITLQILMENGSDEPSADIQMEDIMVLQYTGGTSGVIKACCQTNRAYIARIGAVREFFRPFGINEENFSVIIGIPMSHAYGLAQGIISNLGMGGSIVLTDSGSIHDLFEKIQKYKPVLWPSVPRWLKEFASNPELAEYDISSLKSITCGSAPLPLSIINRVESISGAVITEGYGLSETVNTVTGNPFRFRKAGKVGIPYPNMEYIIVDIDTGEKVVPLGQEGEIIVRGPMVIKEYWNHPDESASSIRHGWFYTGDIGMLDEDGYLQIMDRKKDMLIVSGFNVYPKEIEDLLINYPGIIDVCCIGMADEQRGEIPVVYIVKQKDKEMAESELMDFCCENLARFKVPKELYFIDSIPKTPNNKPDRKALKNIHIMQAKKVQ